MSDCYGYVFQPQASFKFGATTNMLPRPCMAPNVPTVQALETNVAGAIAQAVIDVVTCADKLCYILEFIAQVVQKEFETQGIFPERAYS